ncbi:hypothetical protein pdam_00004221 [Pocillopora damicornis]|uniref:G-protein coupled receptors family 1 profile domain-containing protein n=1 Tax=Pocillopora damicornis TaxID=46731 RepID=A0A3M6UGA1_POCDA|nr:hypothetical protein pdam_00004221 [Pocillopora damicornis]
MVGLYSRVTYTLWLKRDTDYRLTFQQKEELHVRVEVWQEISFPHLISKFCCFTILPSILAPQGVIKGRKRITLMVVAVSVTFAICWGTNQIDYAMMYVASCDIDKVPVAICNIMVLSNFAVNVLVYLSL